MRGWDENYSQDGCVWSELSWQQYLLARISHSKCIYSRIFYRSHFLQFFPLLRTIAPIWLFIQQKYSQKQKTAKVKVRESCRNRYGWKTICVICPKYPRIPECPIFSQKHEWLVWFTSTLVFMLFCSTIENYLRTICPQIELNQLKYAKIWDECYSEVYAGAFCFHVLCI